MFLPRSHPWLLSLGFHLLVGATLLILVYQQASPAPAAVQMRLVSSGGGNTGPGKQTVSQTNWWSGVQGTDSRQAEPELPSWQGVTPTAAAESLTAPVPVLLDELLGSVSETVTQSVRPSSSSSGSWSLAGGEGYEPPPLPPPGVAPPQGAKWNLQLSVPRGGGFASAIEGLDSGNPELDHWLESYLRTVSFPSSLNGEDYQLRWDLRLETGRPR